MIEVSKGNFAKSKSPRGHERTLKTVPGKKAFTPADMVTTYYINFSFFLFVTSVNLSDNVTVTSKLPDVGTV